MTKNHGRTRDELERSGADPNVDDTETSRPEDSWFGGEGYGWFDALLQRFAKRAS
jgi:hypothetical protein